MSDVKGRALWMGAKRWGAILSALGVLALFAVLFVWSREVPLQVTAGLPQKTEMMSEAGAEVFAVPIAISVPGKWPKPNSVVFFEKGTTRAEAKGAQGSGGWTEVHCTFPIDHVSAGWTAEGTVLVPKGTEAVRLRFKCAGRSLPWRVVGVLSGWGVQLSPKLQAKLGPLPGRNPRWKEVIVEVRPLGLTNPG